MNSQISENTCLSKCFGKMSITSIPNKQKGLCSQLVLKCENVHCSHTSWFFNIKTVHKQFTIVWCKQKCFPRNANNLLVREEMVLCSHEFTSTSVSKHHTATTQSTSRKTNSVFYRKDRTQLKVYSLFLFKHKGSFKKSLS